MINNKSILLPDTFIPDLQQSITDYTVASKYILNEETVLKSLEKLTLNLEKTTVASRNSLEINRKIFTGIGRNIEPVSFPVGGKVVVYNEKWLAIKLHTLLPHFTIKATDYVTDTIIRLIVSYRNAQPVPFYDKSFIIIDEHCNVRNRKVFDQDNKGWKQIPNAVKLCGIIPDDDQRHVNLCLMTTNDDKPYCCIYVIDSKDAAEFFQKHNEKSLDFFDGE